MEQADLFPSTSQSRTTSASRPLNLPGVAYRRTFGLATEPESSMAWSLWPAKVRAAGEERVLELSRADYDDLAWLQSFVKEVLEHLLDFRPFSIRARIGIDRRGLPLRRARGEAGRNAAELADEPADRSGVALVDAKRERGKLPGQLGCARPEVLGGICEQDDSGILRVAEQGVQGGPPVGGDVLGFVDDQGVESRAEVLDGLPQQIVRVLVPEMAGADDCAVGSWVGRIPGELRLKRQVLAELVEGARVRSFPPVRSTTRRCDGADSPEGG